MTQHQIFILNKLTSSLDLVDAIMSIS